jgi:putative PEP-CTERM system histidine kinase
MPTALSKVIALGYGLAAIVYLVLAIILVASGRLRSQSHLLVLACALTGLWAVMATIDALNAGPSVFGLLLETARDAAWLALLLYILHLRLSPLPAPLRTVRVIGATLTGALLLALLAPLLSSPVLTDARPVHLGLLGMTVLGLVLVEQVYRSTRQEDRWAIKFLCLGLGTLFVFDFYLYANSALFQATSLDVWGARGYVIMLTAPLVAISAARNPQWSAPVGLSRNMVFHTVSLLGAGVYLLLMAAAGYYLKVFGGNWGNVIQAAFVFSALLLLGLILFSGTWRARLRVFVNKHFFSYRYDYREEWLKFTRTLSSGAPGERLCEHAIESLAQLVDSPGGALWLKEETYAYQRAAHWNWSEIAGREPLDSAFIAWLRQKQWVIDLQELQETPEHYPDLLLPEWLARTGNAWLVIPLMQHDDMLGFIVLKPSLVKISFNWEVGDLLKVAARQATTHLAQMQAANALIVARQFESFNRTTTFVIHDLKNLVAQLSLLLSNAEKHKHKPEFQADVLETVESAVARMNKVLAQLLRGSV